jgi:lipopolysaccharide/colanic/teichoic acid biosynthesis glycosyltransferase
MDANQYNHQFEQSIKRLIDIVFATIVLIVFSPVLIFIAILVKLDSPGPVIYRHKRVGKNGQTFLLYKFRTMVTGGDDHGYMNYLTELIESSNNNGGNGKPYTKMKDDNRVTRVGRILRNHYLDELPQMINVMKGDLSLVGPRPHVQFEVDHYTPEQCRRLSVPPGLTGLWQVSGKAECTFAELIAFDLVYIDTWSFWLDVQILFATVYIMLNGGEGFWTRTHKLIPGRVNLGFRWQTKKTANTTFEPTLTKE